MGYTINADEVQIGRYVTIEDGVFIGDKQGGNCKKVIIGDGVFLGKNSRFFLPSLEIGDYTTINNTAFGSGDKACIIGSCCWFGQNCILDSEGGLEIHNGVGVGAYSQLWSHILFGDTLQGCNWDQKKRLIVEDDVWFVGHCIVSPVHAYKKSMALAGTVVTRDMQENHIYAGTPAKDVTSVLGHQFNERHVEEKFDILCEKYKAFLLENPDLQSQADKIQIVADAGGIENMEGVTYFNVADRTYNKLLTEIEHRFMKYLLVQIKFFDRNRQESFM